MVDQTNAVNGDASPISALLNRSRAFVGTVMDLASLQSELAAEDAAIAQSHLKKTAAIGVVSVVCILAAIPIAAAAMVDLLMVYAQWHLWVACLVVAGALSALAIIFGWLAWKSATKAAGAFATTKREAQANLVWLRQSLSHNDDSNP
jgi:uncharacterized membrane protein